MEYREVRSNHAPFALNTATNALDDSGNNPQPTKDVESEFHFSTLIPLAVISLAVFYDVFNRRPHEVLWVILCEQLKIRDDFTKHAAKMTFVRARFPGLQPNGVEFDTAT